MLLCSMTRRLRQAAGFALGRERFARARLRCAHLLNERALTLQRLSRKLVLSSFPELAGETYHRDLVELHRSIDRELRRQRTDYPHMLYEQGYPYQALHTLGIFGVRPAEERFVDYGLADLIAKEDHVLDIGCNCGFMLLYTAYRTGCSGEGVDINPHMIAIGKQVANFLGLAQRVKLSAARFQEFAPERQYTMIFSFAAHWTDDEQLRPDFDEHLRRLHGLLTEGGRVILESHTADVDNPAFYERMKRQRGLFSWTGSRRLANNRRELFVMRKEPGAGP